MIKSILKFILVLIFPILFSQCNEQLLVNSENHPLGKEVIAYQGFNIYLADADGQNIKNINYGFMDTFYYPYLSKFSPDGSKLLFTMDLLTVGKEDLMFSERDDIYIYDLLTEKTSRLTDTQYKESMPCLSPDGKTIVFLSNEGGGHNLYAMNSNGFGKRLLYSSQDWQWEPEFFSDGRAILFRSRNNALGLSDLYTINIDGTNLVNLTNSQEDIASPVISRDGRYIYYAYYSGFLKGGIYKFDMLTSSKVKISKTEDGYYKPKISGDGAKVTFLKADGSWTYVGLMDSDGSNAFIIDKGSDSEFSRDGKSIFYTGLKGIYVYDIENKTKKTLANTDVGSINLEVN